MRKTLTAIVLAVTTVAGATFATLPASASVTRPGHVRTLPRWAHWKTAPRGACGRSAGIVVWAGHGDGVLICPDGNIQTS
jgi:hypothetical protein